MKRLLSLAPLGLLLVGCGPTPQDYTVVVRNQSERPVTLVLTKDGPPMESKWVPPEDFAAMLHAPADLKVNGIVVRPGQTVDQTRHGDFDAGTRAILRVYGGEQTLETMLGIGPTSPNRADLPLDPGRNEIVVDKTGKAYRQ